MANDDNAALKARFVTKLLEAVQTHFTAFQATIDGADMRHWIVMGRGRSHARMLALVYLDTLCGEIGRAFGCRIALRGTVRAEDGAEQKFAHVAQVASRRAGAGRGGRAMTELLLYWVGPWGLVLFPLIGLAALASALFDR